MRISDWSSDVCSSDLIAFTDLIAIGKEPGRNRSLAVVVPKVVRDRHVRHIYFSVRTCRAKAASRSLLGRTPCSSTGLKGIGISGKARRRGAALSLMLGYSQTEEMTSPPMPELKYSSSTVTTRSEQT